MTWKKGLYTLLLTVIVFSLGLYMTFSTFNRKDYYNYVDSRIEKMMNNPDAMVFSNTGKYIEMSKNEYIEIYKIGGKVLPVLEKIMSEEESKGVHGLRYFLAGQIKQDIVNRTNYFNKVKN